LTGTLLPIDLDGFICDGESEGEIEGAFESALDFGDAILSTMVSPVTLAGRGGYTVPNVFPDTFDFDEKGDRGLSASPDLLAAILLAVLGD
jgi:hypothetical protein